ncbi:hypothetical protein [Halomonas sp.]
MSGFVTTSGILIVTSQLRHVLGVEAAGHNLVEMGSALVAGLGDISCWP